MIDDRAAIELLSRASYGVLSTVGADGLPYGIPISYVFHRDALYLHCAPEGRKLDNIKFSPAVSFCVVGHTRTLPGEFSTEYESAVVSGLATFVSGDEKREALVAILEKYSPEFMTQGQKYLAGKIDHVTVVRLDIEHVSGKARR